MKWNKANNLPKKTGKYFVQLKDKSFSMAEYQEAGGYFFWHDLIGNITFSNGDKKIINKLKKVIPINDNYVKYWALPSRK